MNINDINRFPCLWHDVYSNLALSVWGVQDCRPHYCVTYTQMRASCQACPLPRFLPTGPMPLLLSMRAVLWVHLVYKV